MDEFHLSTILKKWSFPAIIRRLVTRSISYQPLSKPLAGDVSVFGVNACPCCVELGASLEGGSRV